MRDGKRGCDKYDGNCYLHLEHAGAYIFHGRFARMRYDIHPQLPREPNLTRLRTCTPSRSLRHALYQFGILRLSIRRDTIIRFAIFCVKFMFGKMTVTHFRVQKEDS
jgi:hypothetical protein